MTSMNNGNMPVSGAGEYVSGSSGNAEKNNAGHDGGKKRRRTARHEGTYAHTHSLRGRMIAAFMAFALIVLAVLWLLQTVLLGDIYSSLKLNELKLCAQTAARAAEQYTSDTEDELTATVERISREHAVCISVYKIDNTGFRRTGTQIISSHVDTFCFIHNVRSADLLNELYNKSVKGDGQFLHRTALSRSGEGGGENVIYARLVYLNADEELLILLNTELMPLDSTVGTLRILLIIISVILAALSVVLGILLSNHLSRPIREMSREAGRLALGNYDVNFDGGSCTETVQLSETLNRAAYELSKLDKMQKDLIANVSHDLRTPLTMIAGYTEAMRDLPGEATPENMQIVIDETNRLAGLVNDMLEVSKYQNGTQILHPERFCYTELIRTTLERYAKLREKEGYTIKFEADRDVYVVADSGRILQVLYNLINNAVNYTGEDKTVIVRQTVQSSGGRESGDGHELDSGETVLTEVIDTGRGIPKDELPLVWERYYKVHDFHKRANMGTGLGLSIVKNILVLHGAEFGVKSKVGEGSNFWFRLKTTD